MAKFTFSVILAHILLFTTAFAASAPPISPPSNIISPIYSKRPANLTRLRAHGYGQQRTVSYFVVDGLAVIDGDIIFGPVDDLLSPNATASAQRRALSLTTGWPNGNLRYKYDSAATETTLKPIVDGAISRWLAGAPYLRFTQEATSAAGVNGVITIKAPVCGGCNTNIGFSNSPMTMNLQQSCPSAPGTCGTSEATHEFGHSLGFFHEHQRADRETAVHYNCANLDPTCPAGVTMPAGKTCCDSGLPAGCCGNSGNFGIVSGANIDSTLKYDVTSIMQYRSNAFAKPGTLTLTPAAPGIVVPPSNPSNPSSLDFQRVCKIYSGICPRALECNKKGCPTDCIPVRRCNNARLCSGPEAIDIPCCRPTCKPTQAQCTAANCDFLR